jgi:hypothetical protein
LYPPRLAKDANVEGDQHKFNGLVDIYVKMLSSDWIQGFFRGPPDALQKE